MLEKANKHANKILFFLINVLLAAVAVLIIRGKDQNRLLSQAENNSGAGSAGQDTASPESLKGSLPGAEQVQSFQDSGQAATNSGAANLAGATGAINVPVDSSSQSVNTSPNPAGTSTKSNRQTKTS